MKKVSYLWSTIILLTLLLTVSLAGNVGLIDLPQKLRALTSLPKTEVVFRLSDIEFELRENVDGMALLTADFIVENISKIPQTIRVHNLGVFDCEECLYDISDNYHSKLYPLLYSETINPNSKKKICVGFEVPKGKLYCMAVTDNIEITGIQKFTDRIRNIKCSYENLAAMKKIAINNNQRSDGYIEQKVDLNDYLGSPEDDTDWNYTEIDEEAMKYLDSLGIYLSVEKKCWVKKIPVKN